MSGLFVMWWYEGDEDRFMEWWEGEWEVLRKWIEEEEVESRGGRMCEKVVRSVGGELVEVKWRVE